LYFAPHSHAWFASRDWPFDYEIGVWRSLSVPTLQACAHELLAGKALLRAVARFEDRFPSAAGRYGRYPLLTLRKHR